MPSGLPTDTLKSDLIDVVFAAGDAIREVQRARIDVRHKSDASPVTEADERAEAIILAALARLTPDTPVVAEEQVSAGTLPDIADKPFWLVDPLDGTKEFIRGGVDFTVNVALIDDGVPVLGLVYAPADGRLFVGSAEGGAAAGRRGEDGSATLSPAHTRRARPDGLTIVASRSHSNPETETYLANYPGADCVSIGSSLKFCLVAAGQADLYPRLGPTMEWDTAAGHAVLLAAGGAVTAPGGGPLAYRKPDFRNGFFLARGDVAFTPAPLPDQAAA